MLAEAVRNVFYTWQQSGTYTSYSLGNAHFFYIQYCRQLLSNVSVKSLEKQQIEIWLCA